MAKSVNLSTRRFDTQGAANTFFRAMLNRYKPGNRVKDEDALDLGALLLRHHEYATKAGTGVDHFEVMMTEHGSQCFRIVRADGTGTDFSYIQCIKNRPPTVKQEVSQAFRQAVKFDLYKARDDFFSTHQDSDGLIVCAASGERISRDMAHMDHRPPMTFEVLVTTFLCSRGMSWDDVALTSGQDNQVNPEITDSELRETFRVFHARTARLDYVRNNINLSESSRHRLKTGRVKIDSENK
jgi:hypothetical protein